MAEVLSFKGLLYNTSKVKVEDVVAPPYDVISPEEQERLYQRSPYNVVRLILGKETPRDTLSDNRYTRARAFLEEWIREEILIRDAQERLYLYRQEFSALGRKWRRMAFFARVRLADFSEGVIIPHERTLSAPKEDRLKLLRECRVNFSPIFGLFPDEDGGVYSLLKEASEVSPFCRFGDEAGVIHEFWLLDGTLVEDIKRSFGSQPILIADGHHRYETALQYRKERTQANPNHTGREPYNFVMMALVSMKDPGLLVFPTHRVLKGDLPYSAEVLEERLGRYFERVALYSDLNGLLSALDGASPHVFGLHFSGGPFLLVSLKKGVDLDRELSHLPPPMRELDVILLHELLLERVFGVSHEEVRDKGRLGYYKDARQALEDVDKGVGSLAAFLRAPSVDEIWKVARVGETMPQKSTYFYPKLITGLVMNPLD